MKEFVGLARNVYFVFGKDKKDGEPKLVANAEIVIHVTEPLYRFDGLGDMHRHREVESMRFTAFPESLRQIADYLNKAADDMEEAEEGMCIAAKNPPDAPPVK